MYGAYYPNHAPNLVLTCLGDFRNLITTFLINLVGRELPREHRAVRVLRRRVVVSAGGRGGGDQSFEGDDLIVAFKSAGRTFAASVVACARR
jgi:hypothetical protein